MDCRVCLGVVVVALLVGCAGVVPNAYVYSPEEKEMMRGQLGTPSEQLNAMGEARYCSAMPTQRQVEEQKRQALANIAKVCGGDDKYYVTGELASDAQFAAMGLIKTSCGYGAGRAIYFKCKGANPTPTAHSK